jgi:general stress protein 26
MTKGNHMSTSLTKEFWDRAGNVNAGMLSGDGLTPRPMSHNLRDGDDALWFITAKQTDVAQAAAKGARAQHILACSHGQIYAAIDGKLTIETSEAILEAVWFEDGRDDDDVCLVRFTPSKAEIWATDGTAKALYSFAKASLSDETPNMGQHGVLKF